ncbi:MAG TPA: sigma-70 family RNA polymerase sigma factor [Solirubrobacterales bacterium]|nr:sigma-70 family RNA polymerase sigma factor [Solirubrobacterales bacterium]
MSNHELARIGHDPDALEAFYREHVESVERFVARRVSDPYLAADLTTEIFLAVIEAADRYDNRRGRPKAWLFGIARNVIHNEFRRIGRDRDAMARVQGQRLLDDDDLARMQERIDAEATSRRLLAAFESLPDGERRALELYALDELSPREVGEALGISPVTARVRLHRARRTLRRNLPDEEPTTTIPTLET